jgi:hypothetical protein
MASIASVELASCWHILISRLAFMLSMIIFKLFDLTRLSLVMLIWNLYNVRATKYDIQVAFYS